jgi:hypothetical protein
MNGKDVELAVADMVSVLTPHVDQDWQVHARSLDWTCWKTAAHVGHDLLAYTTQITSRATSAYLPCSLLIDANASPRQVLEVITASGALLAAAINTAGRPLAPGIGAHRPRRVRCIGGQRGSGAHLRRRAGSGRSVGPCGSSLRGSSEPTLFRGFDAFYCIPGVEGAHEKGGVEGEVGRFRCNHLVPQPEVAMLGELNERLERADAADDHRRIENRVATVGQDFVVEQLMLRPLPTEGFDAGLTLTRASTATRG